MEWQIVAVMVVVIPIILLPVIFVWYLTIGGIIVTIRERKAGLSGQKKPVMERTR